MVARDGGHLVRALEGETARTFLVTIEGAHSIAGRLVVREADGTETARPISGDRCEDVVRSLAVLVALSLQTAVSSAPPLAAAARSERAEHSGRGERACRAGASYDFLSRRRNRNRRPACGYR